LLQENTIPEESEEVQELGEDEHITLEQFVTLFYKLEAVCEFLFKAMPSTSILGIHMMHVVQRSVWPMWCSPLLRIIGTSI
jgi:hypothetical protein